MGGVTYFCRHIGVATHLSVKSIDPHIARLLIWFAFIHRLVRSTSAMERYAHLRPLVGRRSEEASLVEAASHPPSVTCVEGEAGIGKSRLVEELLERVELRQHPTAAGSLLSVT